jgi:hypothetical protein
MERESKLWMNKQLPPSLVNLLTTGVTLTHWIAPAPPREVIVEQLEAAIAEWPWNTDHLTIDVSTSGAHVLIFGMAANEDEVARFEALRVRYGSSVGFDIRLFDATPCEQPDAGGR